MIVLYTFRRMRINGVVDWDELLIFTRALFGFQSGETSHARPDQNCDYYSAIRLRRPDRFTRGGRSQKKMC